jgi:acyl carrier protein
MPAEHEIRQRLQAVFRDVFEDDDLEIFDAMTAEDVEEWDSVSHISLILAVEETFGIRLSAAAVGKLDNVGSMVALLRDSLPGD